MPAVAYFASRASELVVVEKPAVPIWEGGRQIGSEPGRYHHFSDHRLRVEGQRSIDFLRERANAVDSPGLWEISAFDAAPAIELLAEIATAEPERVREILETEREEAKRPEIIETAERVLERYAAQSPMVEPEPEPQP